MLRFSAGWETTEQDWRQLLEAINTAFAESARGRRLSDEMDSLYHPAILQVQAWHDPNVVAPSWSMNGPLRSGIPPSQ